MMWYCKRCRKRLPAQLVNGKQKVARFRSGFVGIYLTCGHAVAIRHDRIK